MASSMKQLDLFDVLPAATEGTDLEFKAAKGGLPGSFWESYSAMANTEGGMIVLGVAERSGVLSWDGVADPAQLRTTLWNQINDRQKVSANLLTSDAINTWTQEGRQFVAVTVPRVSNGRSMLAKTPSPAPTGAPRTATTTAAPTKCAACWPTKALQSPSMPASWSTLAWPISTATRSSNTATASHPARLTTPGCRRTMPACCSSWVACDASAQVGGSASPWLAC